jgi:hypothetical protein
MVVLTYGDNQVVPFTLNKSSGVLDFDFSGSFSATTTIDTNQTAYVQGASFSALHIVNDIGPNIVAWCEQEANADSGSVEIVEKPIVVRSNQIAVGREPNSDNTMEESDVAFDFENASGSVSNNFNATYLFKKPLVVTYTVNGVRKYRMFNTQNGGQT